MMLNGHVLLASVHNHRTIAHVFCANRLDEWFFWRVKELTVTNMLMFVIVVVNARNVAGANLVFGGQKHLRVASVRQYIAKFVANDREVNVEQAREGIEVLVPNLGAAENKIDARMHTNRCFANHLVIRKWLASIGNALSEVGAVKQHLQKWLGVDGGGLFHGNDVRRDDGHRNIAVDVASKTDVVAVQRAEEKCPDDADHDVNHGCAFDEKKINFICHSSAAQTIGCPNYLI